VYWAEVSGQFGTSMPNTVRTLWNGNMVPKCLDTEMSWGRSVPRASVTQAEEVFNPRRPRRDVCRAPGRRPMSVGQSTRFITLTTERLTCYASRHVICQHSDSSSVAGAALYDRARQITCISVTPASDDVHVCCICLYFRRISPHTSERC